MPDPPGLLAGLRVLEVGPGRFGLCGRYLADLGAEVVLIEPPGGMPERTEGSLHDGISVRFAAHHAGKLSIELDPALDRDRERFVALAREADLLIDTRAAGSPPPWGMGPKDLRALAPHLVVVCVTDFGQVGPYRDWVATPWTHLAMAAVLARSGDPQGPPLMPPSAIGVESAVLQAAWAGLASYWRRLRTGEGDLVDLSVHEAVLQIVDPAFGTGGTAGAGRKWYELPHGRPDAAHFYPVLPCANGSVRMAVLAPRQWRALRSWLDEPPEFQDPKFDLVFHRFAAADTLYPLVEKLFSDKTVETIVEEGQRRGIPLAPVLHVGEVLTAEHYRVRGAIAPIELIPGTVAAAPTGFVEVDGVRAGPRSPVPAAGSTSELPPRPAHTPPDEREGRPFEGLRVLDLGVIVQGAEAGRLFADLGAEVIKVESRAFPDQGRVAAGGDMTYSFAWGNRNKRSLGLNLRSPEGIGIFTDLAATADVVLSNFKPGTLESLGIGYDVLSAVNPRLVMGTSSAVGSSGPWRSWMGYGPLVRAATGLTSLWRTSAGSTSYGDAVTVHPDHTAARVLGTAVLAGLIAARTSGRGCHIESSQAETILTQFSAEYLQASLEPGSVLPVGNASRDHVPWGIYPCAGDDEWCVITARDDADWRRLAGVILDPELDPDWTATDRLARRRSIDAAVSRWTETLVPLEVAARAQEVQVPAAPMVRPVELGTDPHLAARSYWTVLAQPGIREPLPTESRPFSSAAVRDWPPTPAPFHGQDTRVLSETVLGLPTEETERLLAAGILEEIDPWRKVRR